MDLLHYKSGTGESEDGYILAERVMTGGQGVNFTGSLKGGVWTVAMTRKLTSDKLGDISMATTKCKISVLPFMMITVIAISTMFH